MKYLAYLFSLLVLGSPLKTHAQSLSAEDAALYTPYYQGQQIGLLTFPGYTLANSQLTWLPKEQKPLLHISYHRAVPFIDRGLTVHFSLVVRHSAQNQAVAPDYHCQATYQQVEFQHPQFGPYVLCTKTSSTAAPTSASNQKPIAQTVAFVRPRIGNKMPHISLNLHGFPQDIIPLLRSLHSYAGN